MENRGNEWNSGRYFQTVCDRNQRNNRRSGDKNGNRRGTHGTNMRSHHRCGAEVRAKMELRSEEQKSQQHSK